ncbi:MAG: PIG-L family deacetylase [Candidatus Lokiarchaeota archaeon]|nr:PIG-L family deacetylase [Candidatus Lokiarchaeota archaeon]
MENNESIISDKDIPVVVPKRMLVFAGHPDDEIISCGGTILKYQALGSEVFVVVATSGLGGYAKSDQKTEIESQRKQELELIRTTLKCNVIELGYDNLEVNSEHISKITNLIRDIKPQVILIPHYSDFHRVHRNLSLIAKEAIYHCSTGKAYGGSQRNWTPLGVYYYESPSCKFQYVEGSVFIVVDIERYWSKKKEIFNIVYLSQKEVLERVLEWAEDTATLRGNEINSTYGEAYIPETTYTPLKILLL